MNIFKTIFKNTSWLVFSEVITKVIGLILTILIARYFGTDGFGIYSFVLAFAMLFTVLSDFGLATITTRDLSKDKKQTEKYINNISIIKIFLSMITLLLIITTIQFFNKTLEITFLVYLAGIWMVASSFEHFFFSIFRAYEKMKYEAIINILSKILWLIATIIVVILKLNLTILFILYIFTIIPTFILLIYYLKKNFKRVKIISLKINKEFCKYILKESWPLAIGFSLVSIYYYIDTIILSVYYPDRIVGLYNAAYKIIIFLIAGRRIFTTTIYPKISEFYKTSKEKLRELIIKSEKLSITIAMPLVTGGILLSDKIITLIYGAEFIEASLPFRLLLFQVFFIYINLIFTPFLHASGQQKTYTKVVSFGGLINLILNLILIPKFAMIGAATSTIFSEFSVFALAYYFTRKKIKIKILNLFLKPITATIPMFIIIYLIRDLNLFISITTGVIIYFLSLLIIKGIKKEDFALNT